MVAADTVLKNANVITMDLAQPRAGLVAIRGNRALAVAKTADLPLFTGSRTRVIDLAGRTVVPGFNDAHCHVFSLLRKLLGVDVSPDAVRSIAEIKDAIRREAQRTPPGTWISGLGCNEFYLAEKRCPDRLDLDEVAPEHPVVLSHRSLHACFLNSRALALAGITRETPDPPGALIDRDLDGEPTGVLFEMLGYIREKVMPPISDEDLAKSMSLANEYYLSRGITSLQEATVTNEPGRWRLYRQFKDNGVFKSRVAMMLCYDKLVQFKDAGLAPGNGDSQLRLGAIKFLLSEATGHMQPSPELLKEQVRDCHRAGYQVAIHAIEPIMVEAAVAAIEYARQEHPRPEHRHRIEHCSVCPPELLERLTRVKVVVATQPPFIYYSGERYLATVPAADQPWLYRIKSMLGRGIIVAAGSDSPIVDADPLAGIYAAVTRRARSGQAVRPEEAITPEAALALYTRNAAYISLEENIKGKLAPGMLADMVVLSADPFASPPEALKDIRVEMTIIDGRVVWER